MSNALRISTSRTLKGVLQVPGDKSISHRVLLLGSIAQGTSRIKGFLEGRDCLATAAIMRQLGIEITQQGDCLFIKGAGFHGLRAPSEILNCENSGTTIRLLAGLLSAQQFSSTLDGSNQIRHRPMGRVTKPLRQMGANISGQNNGELAPLVIEPVTKLTALPYTMDVASAQVKSALILAGLYADAPMQITEPGPSRDHTERMLTSMGAVVRSPFGKGGRGILVAPLTSELTPLDLHIPGDISSAAFLLVAAAITNNSQLKLTHVGINPTRTGIIAALQKMGATIHIENEREESGEPVADLVLNTTDLHAADFSGEIIVRMIDELPILAVAATQAKGTTTIRDAKELIVKESNRIQSTVTELTKMGAHIQATPDGFIIDGPTPLSGAAVDSYGDHRLAMALTIAGLVAEGETVVSNAHVTTDSFPGFTASLKSLGANIVEL